MGYPASPEKLIRYYQRQLPLINGNFGTFFLSPLLFFKMSGFPVRIAFRRKKFDVVARQSDACILFYYWRRKFKIGSHFVAVHQQKGSFVGYNTFSNSTVQDNYGSSISEFLKRQKYFGPVLIGIKDKHQGENNR